MESFEFARTRLERIYYFSRKIPYEGKGMLVAAASPEKGNPVDFANFPRFILDFDVAGAEFIDSTWNFFNKEFVFGDGHHLRVASLDGHGVHTVFYPLALPTELNGEHEVVAGHKRAEFDFKPWRTLAALSCFARLIRNFYDALRQPLPYLVSMRVFDTEGLSFTSNPSGVRFQSVRTILHREELDFPTQELASVDRKVLTELVMSMASFIFRHFNFMPGEAEMSEEITKWMGSP